MLYVEAALFTHPPLTFLLFGKQFFDFFVENCITKRKEGS